MVAFKCSVSGVKVSNSLDYLYVTTSDYDVKEKKSPYPTEDRDFFIK